MCSYFENSIHYKKFRNVRKVNRTIDKKYLLLAANPRITFMSKPLLRPGAKDPISNLNKSIIVYEFSCCCKASYIKLTTRHIRKRIKEHVPKSVENFCLLYKKDDIPVKVSNESKRSSTAENFVNNSTCANS